MTYILREVVPLLALYMALYAAIGRSVSFPRAVAIGLIVGVFRMHAVWMVGK